jgi:hypothetical protein
MTPAISNCLACNVVLGLYRPTNSVKDCNLLERVVAAILEQKGQLTTPVNGLEVSNNTLIERL